MRMSETLRRLDWRQMVSRAAAILVLLAGLLLATGLCIAATPTDHPVPNIFEPHSTPAESIRDLSHFVLGVTGLIFLVVFSLLTYAVVKFRRRPADAGREPAQVYGSTQIELAWTIIPILIVVVLFLATARVIHAIQDAARPAKTVEVTAIGHQFWWEFRYPELGIVTANELHVPVSDPSRPTPTFLRLLSADTDHSFWIPQLAGKTDLIPNRVNKTWLDPQETGLFLGQCAQYCGTQHAKMLLRVYVDRPEDFNVWVSGQRQPANDMAFLRLNAFSFWLNFFGGHLLLAWHVPALFMLGMHSAVWHSLEQGSFLVAGFLFWWPVVQAWPSNAPGPQFSTLLYLFLATLPCDILSGFLVFSDRVAYPVYLSVPRHFGFSVLEDQQCAAALMWTCVTLVYLVPAAIISSRLLAPRTSHEHDLQQSQFSGGRVPQNAPRRLEVV
jgi:cytochrome c oxidase subunit 2